MKAVFEKCLADLSKGDESAPIFRHHIHFVENAHYNRETAYRDEPPAMIVADYIASMTDDYFIDLYAFLFPESPEKIFYTGYFD